MKKSKTESTNLQLDLNMKRTRSGKIEKQLLIKPVFDPFFIFEIELFSIGVYNIIKKNNQAKS